MRHALVLAAAFGLLTAPLLVSPASAQTIIYLNFDEQEETDGDGIRDRDPYVLGSTEVGTNLPGQFGELNLQFEWKAGTPPHAEDVEYWISRPAIGPIPEGVTIPASLEGMYGDGKQALLLQPEIPFGSGIRVISDNGIAPQSVTMEAVWWTESFNGADNEAGIQSIAGNEGAFGQELGALFMRTVFLVGNPWMEYATDREGLWETIRVIGGGAYTTNTLYHDVLVLEYNDVDPMQCILRGYRNGQLVTIQAAASPHNGQTQAPYSALRPGPENPDATERDLIPTILFGSRYSLYDDGPFRSLSVGYNITNEVFVTDQSPDSLRALTGGVAAFALTLDALQPEDFVLATGVPIPFPEGESLDTWAVY